MLRTTRPTTAFSRPTSAFRVAGVPRFATGRVTSSAPFAPRQLNRHFTTSIVLKRPSYEEKPISAEREPIAAAQDIITNRRLEDKPYKLWWHRKVTTTIDAIAFAIVKALRVPADLIFAKRYGHRAIVLETVAAVPGMVAGMLRHMRSLRLMKHDGGWIHELLDEAENERMHLLTFIKLYRPSLLERLLVLAVQGVFFNLYFLLYIISPRLCHRIVGYLEEEAIKSYTQYLHEIDSGRTPNVPAPKIAIDYWKLPQGATLRDVVLAVRADEARHRDVNHRFADAILTNENPDIAHTIPINKQEMS